MSRVRTMNYCVAVLVAVVCLTTASSAQAGDLPKYKRQRIAGWTMAGVGASALVSGIAVLRTVGRNGDDGGPPHELIGLAGLIAPGVFTAAFAATPLLVKSRKGRLRAQREASTQLHLQPLTEPSFQRESEASRSIIPPSPEPKINFSIGPGSMTVAGRF